MKYEKSCGAVIWRQGETEREYLIILNKKGNALGHWGFPKGHVEKGEDELDTARREIREEVGLEVDEFMPDFRIVNRYNPRPGVEKDAVYFIAETQKSEIHIQECEIADYAWLGYSDAQNRVTHDMRILDAAEEFLKEKL